MRKLISSLCSAVIVVAPMFLASAVPMAARATSIGLIKGSGATVYWNSVNGKRYVFPTYGTFWSWYGFSETQIQDLTDSELGMIPIGGNVTYRPGVRMLKITTDPKVYAVGRYGELHWVTNENIATQLYGNDWMHQIHDMPDAFFVNYKIGSPIASVSDFDPASQTAAVSSPEDNIGTPPAAQAPTNTGTVSVITTSLTPDKTQVNLDDTVTYLASVKDPDGLSKFEIYINGNQVNECVVTGLTEKDGCGITFVAKQYEDANAQLAFSARAVDAYGNVVWSDLRVIGVNSGFVIPPTPTATTYGISLTASANAIQSGDNVSFTANANAATGDFTGTRIEIWDSVRQALVQTCQQASACTTSLSVTRPSAASYGQYVAYVKNASNAILATGYSPLITFNGLVQTTAGRIDLDKTSHASGEMVTVSLTAPSSIPVDHVNAVFYRENMNQSVWSCGGRQVCTMYVADWSNGFATTRYYAMVYDRAPGASGNGTYVATVYSPTITYTSYTVCPSTVCTYDFPKGPNVAASSTSTVMASSWIWTNYNATNLYLMTNGSYTSDHYHVGAIDPAGIQRIDMYKNDDVYNSCDFGTAKSGNVTCEVGVYAVDFPVGTVINVYAKITNGNGSVTRSDTKTFTIARQTEPAPTITSPTVDQVFTNVPRTMTVVWANDNKPKHYVEVTCDYCGTTQQWGTAPTMYTSVNSAMSYAVPAIASDDQLRVRVQAVDANGINGVWSDYVYFSFRTTAASMPAVGLIKGSYSQIYWYSRDGKRYVMTTPEVLQTWYGSNTPQTQTISDTVLAGITIGGSVLEKPGVHMIKIATDPKVYAVSRYGVLRLISSTIAQQLYGDIWASLVDTVPDNFFVSYMMGSSLNSASDFDPAVQSAAVSSPDDNIAP